jgi:hypothetical protein
MRKNLLGSLVQIISRPPLDRAHGRPFFPRCRVKTRCFLIKASNKKDVNARDKSTIVHEPVNRGVDWSVNSTLTANSSLISRFAVSKTGSAWLDFPTRGRPKDERFSVPRDGKLDQQNTPSAVEKDCSCRSTCTRSWHKQPIPWAMSDLGQGHFDPSLLTRLRRRPTANAAVHL